MPTQVINGVKQFYGPRGRYEATYGKTTTRDFEEQLVITFTGENYASVTGVLPAGATVVGNALVEVTEAFVLGGTTPLLNIGVSGTEATNRVAQLSEAQAEAVGTYSIASAGTLAVNAPLAAAATIKVTLTGGGANTIGLPGQIKVTIPYQMI